MVENLPESEISYKGRVEIKNSPYSVGERFEFAYAITTHLSQGAQYPSGIYIHEYLGKDIQKNLDYTGVTRFKKFLIYVIDRCVCAFMSPGIAVSPLQSFSISP